MGLTTYGNYSIETLRLHGLRAQDRPALCHEPVGHSAAAAGYYVSCAKGLDVDKPRNLAKSVTVE